jgi:hypothetical protein
METRPTAYYTDPWATSAMSSRADELHAAMCLPEENMTLQQAKSIARQLGLTLRKVRCGDYRVNFRDGNETTAYYTDNLEDTVNTVVEMARKRGQSRC